MVALPPGLGMGWQSRDTKVESAPVLALPSVLTDRWRVVGRDCGLGPGIVNCDCGKKNAGEGWGRPAPPSTGLGSFLPVYPLLETQESFQGRETGRYPWKRMGI